MLSAYQGKAVIVTGGLGFIGSNLAIQLVEAGADVTVIDSMVSGCGANWCNLAQVRSDVRVIVSDIGCTDQFGRVLKGVDVVFNLAGEISHSRSMEDPERDLALNTLSQLRFLLACREHCPGARVVYAGTRQVYGQHESLPVDECHPIQPLDFNGVHKHAATQYHLLLTRRGDLDCIVLRLSNVYGPRMAIHLAHQGFLGAYFRMALEGKPILVYGEGEQLRDPVHVEDVVDAFLRCGCAGEPRHRIFNIGGSQALSLQEIARTMASSSRGCQIQHVPFPEKLRSIDIGSYYSDTRRAQRELGWMPGVLFKDGVRDTIAFFRRHQEHYLRPVAPALGPEIEPLGKVLKMRASSAS
jgi:nucleoside-diphosphate-sugar epimerase